MVASTSEADAKGSADGRAIAARAGMGKYHSELDEALDNADTDVPDWVSIHPLQPGHPGIGALAGHPLQPGHPGIGALAGNGGRLPGRVCRNRSEDDRCCERKAVIHYKVMGDLRVVFEKDTCCIFDGDLQMGHGL